MLYEVITTSIFLFLCLVLFLSYGYILQIIREKSFGVKKILLLFGLSLAALLPSYPALSHDIFNYIFNAKMVVDYHANPHVMVAMDFPNDPWLRFMHNVHRITSYNVCYTKLLRAGSTKAGDCRSPTWLKGRTRIHSRP